MSVVCHTTMTAPRRTLEGCGAIGSSTIAGVGIDGRNARSSQPGEISLEKSLGPYFVTNARSANSS